MKNPSQSTQTLPSPVQPSPGTHTERVTILRQFIQTNADSLLQTLEGYARQAGLAQGKEVKQVALELLSELTIEALEHAERFDPSHQPIAWLLGIGANLVKRRRVARAKQSKREPFAREFPEVNADQAALSDAEVFDRVAALRVTYVQRNGFEDAIASDEETVRLLAPLTGEERRIVLLAKVVEMDGDELARLLGITPTTARQRLFRALNHLRQVWTRDETVARDG